MPTIYASTLTVCSLRCHSGSYLWPKIDIHTHLMSVGDVAKVQITEKQHSSSCRRTCSQTEEFHVNDNSHISDANVDQQHLVQQKSTDDQFPSSIQINQVHIQWKHLNSSGLLGWRSSCMERDRLIDPWRYKYSSVVYLVPGCLSISGTCATLVYRLLFINNHLWPFYNYNPILPIKSIIKSTHHNRCLSKSRTPSGHSTRIHCDWTKHSSTVNKEVIIIIITSFNTTAKAHKKK